MWERIWKVRDRYTRYGSRVYVYIHIYVCIFYSNIWRYRTAWRSTQNGDVLRPRYCITCVNKRVIRRPYFPNGNPRIAERDDSHFIYIYDAKILHMIHTNDCSHLIEIQISRIAVHLQMEIILQIWIHRMNIQRPAWMHLYNRRVAFVRVFEMLITDHQVLIMT